MAAGLGAALEHRGLSGAARAAAGSALFIAADDAGRRARGHRSGSPIRIVRRGRPGERAPSQMGISENAADGALGPACLAEACERKSACLCRSHLRGLCRRRSGQITTG